MDFEKFTDRARGFVQAAQTIAMRESHQRLAPEHLLKALMDDGEGLAANLIARAGGEADKVRKAVDAAVSKMPKVQGGQFHMDPGFARVVDQAEQLARKAGDSFVTVERVLVALA
ncbi:MAG: Clp protease N-terminal domain-containing protein, partial [Pseudomonadota bacterium]|nr:Clp protease N-terminal domain-containing protein [Pseudomonadota bacterium]